MSDPIYFQLNSFPDIPFIIESVDEKEEELVFNISAKNPEQECLMNSVEFRTELKLFLEELVKNTLDKVKETLDASKVDSETQ